MRRIEVRKDENPKELMSKYGISKATAYRAIKRGYFILDAHTREINIDPNYSQKKFFTTKQIFGMCWAIVRKHWPDILKNHPEVAQDMVSEGVLRLIEMSGDPRFNRPKWRWAVAKNGMRNYLYHYFEWKKRKESLLGDEDIRASNKYEEKTRPYKLSRR